MSLGGYKFAGRYCQKGSLTDQQWALLMHKTKVAAFMAANALANAGWDYDMTGSPDGNYHCLDSVGYNYVTCFKRVVDENTKHYFSIFTLTRYGGTSVTTQGYVATNRFYVPDSSRNYRIGVSNASYFVRIGTVRINYSTAVTDFYNGQSLLMPVGNPGYKRQTWSATSTYTGTASFFALTINYYGFAIKESSIITFAGPSISGVAVSIISLDAFSSKFIDGNNPLDGSLIINKQSMHSGGSKYDEMYDAFSSAEPSVVVASLINGGQRDRDSLSFIGCAPVSFYNGAIQSYPFQSVVVNTYMVDEVTYTTARGTVNVDLLAINYPSSNPTVFTTVANGNYLVLLFNTLSNDPQTLFGLSTYPSGHDMKKYAVYVGWDPSNPDITQDSSWQLYDGT